MQARLVYCKKSSKNEKEKRIALTCSFAKDVEAYVYLLYAVPCNCKIIGALIHHYSYDGTKADLKHTCIILADKKHTVHCIHDIDSSLKPYLKLKLIHLIHLINFDFKHFNFTIAITFVFHFVDF